MGAEASILVAAPPRRESLTRKASLTAVASLVDYGAKIIVGIVVTPILVSGLGTALYGVWEMLTRLVNYMVAADGRPTEALRLIVANHQERADEARQRRHVGSPPLVWLFFFPLVAVVGGVFICLATAITHA